MEANQTASGRGSRATGAAQAATREKAFACTHPGCTKRFTRAEHLQRHALNHVPGGGAACPLCQAHFKRPDLLNRHMERHQQKDIEAGGPGYGVLDTRKRAWQAPDGTIKDTNPRSRASARLRKETQSSRESSQSSQQQEQGFQQQQQASNRQPQQQQLQQQPSPESEEHDTCSNPVDERHNISWDSTHSLDDNTQDLRHNFAAGVGGAFGHQSWNRTSIDQHDDHSRNQLDFTFTNTGAGLSSTTPPIYDELNYDQIFQPDTASSFNMPYTTALDYDWLLSGAKQHPSIPIQQHPMAGNNQHPGQNHQAFDISPPSTSSQLWSLPSDSGFGDASVVSLGGNRCAPGQGSPDETDLSAAFTLVQDLPMMPNSNIDQMLGSSGPPPRQPVRTQIRRKQQQTQQRPQQQQQQQQQQPYVPEAQRINIPERPFSTLQGTINVPQIDHETRNIILGVIDSSGPSLPNGHDTPLSQLPLLSLESLQEYLELFFTRFNTSYPLIHLPTFSPSKTEPLLLISILVLGATYSTKDAHQVAVCIHDVIRPLIFAHAGFSAKPQMWSLQTILLVECFGKSRAGLKQHEMSHLFHGLLINLIRRSDCQSVKPQGPGVRARQDTNEDTAWHQWAAQEERKRLALFCFMWDTQHAVLFCQSLCMSSFELRVDLPCPQAIWEAPDSAAWSQAWRDTPSAAREIPYLLALKSYLSPSTARPFVLDAMSRVLVLHGLMSVAWDMQRRDQTSLGMNPINNTEAQVDWKRVIGGAYDAWQRDFDVHCATAVAHMRSNSIERNNSNNTQQNPALSSDELRARCDALWSFSASYSTLAGCAQILLNMDFLDVQVYAGARQILGRPVQQRDYIRSAAVVKKWAAVTKPTTGTSTPTIANPGFATNDQGKHAATIAATHAALNLHRHMDYLTSQDAMSLFHVPWCIYLLTLTLWSSQHARSIDPPTSHGSHLDSFAMDEDDEMVWDAHAEMQGLLLSLIENDGAPPRSGAAKRRTNGLVWIMTETLTKVRWGIIHGAVSVLKGLVPQRLIHRYNEEPMDSKDFGV